MATLGCHLPAALRTASALGDTIIHAADLLAGLGAFLTDLCAFGAGMLVMRRANQHKMRRGPADLSAGHHGTHVAWLNVLAALLQAMVHRHTKAGLVAAQAFIDAGLHLGRSVMHVAS